MSDSQNPYAPPAATASARGIEWMMTDSAALSKTALGLSLVYFGIVLFLFSIILTFGVIFSPALIITIGGILIASIMMFMGPLFCLSVPAETNAKGLIIGTVVLQVINFTFAVLPAAGVELSGFESFTQIFGVLSAICFVLFMRRLAQFIGREDLASRAKNILVLGIVFFLTAIGGIVSMIALGPIAGILLLVVLVMGLVLFVMYANLVNALRKALQEIGSSTSSVATAE